MINNDLNTIEEINWHARTQSRLGRAIGYTSSLSTNLHIFFSLIVAS